MSVCNFMLTKGQRHCFLRGGLSEGCPSLYDLHMNFRANSKTGSIFGNRLALGLDQLLISRAAHPVKSSNDKQNA